MASYSNNGLIARGLQQLPHLQREDPGGDATRGREHGPVRHRPDQPPPPKVPEVSLWGMVVGVDSQSRRRVMKCSEGSDTSMKLLRTCALPMYTNT